ncbi:hypothetical protein [Mycobacterium sp. URHB0021]|jgi:hypothetical protein
MTDLPGREMPVLDRKADRPADHKLSRIVSVLCGSYPEHDQAEISEFVGGRSEPS